MRRRIRRIKLQLALHKTEVLAIHAPWQKLSPPDPDRCGQRRNEVPDEIYETDPQQPLVFRGAFRLIPRLEGAVSALGRLLPNLQGPRDWVSRLYVSMNQSVALYETAIMLNHELALFPETDDSDHLTSGGESPGLQTTVEKLPEAVTEDALD